jgi:hypothetical protein
VHRKTGSKIEVLLPYYPPVAQPLIARQCSFLILTSNTNENLIKKFGNLELVGVGRTTVASMTQAQIKQLACAAPIFL